MPSREYLSVIDIAVAVLRHRGRIIRTSAAAVFTVGFVIIALGREYASEIKFVPDTGNSSVGALSGLAAQFGLSAALGTGGQSPDFYVSLTKSRTIFGAIADTTFRFQRTRGFLWWRDTVEERGTIAELYGIERPANRARERDDAIELLGELVSARASLETGIVTVRAVTDWPELSYAVTAMIADLLGRYSLETMQSRASEERRFVDGRLEAQRAELVTDEDSLRMFLEKNRLFSSSPQLLLEHDRLQRKIVLRQQIVIGLAQAYEQSRIEEVRNTPVLTVVQGPEIPAAPVRRHLGLKLIAVLLLMLAGTVGFAIVQEDAKRDPDEPPATPEDLRRLLGDIGADLRRFTPKLLHRVLGLSQRT